MNKKKVKIILCKECEGEGQTHHCKLVDYHKGLYKEWEETCNICRGSGRIQRTTETTITEEPYETPRIDIKVVHGNT